MATGNYRSWVPPQTIPIHYQSSEPASSGTDAIPRTPASSKFQGAPVLTSKANLADRSLLLSPGLMKSPLKSPPMKSPEVRSPRPEAYSMLAEFESLDGADGVISPVFSTGSAAARTTGSANEDGVVPDETADSQGPVDESAIEETDGQAEKTKEWDASKVPPSQFQRPQGSIFATPGSRDSHVTDKSRDRAFHEKLKEKGWQLRRDSLGRAV